MIASRQLESFFVITNPQQDFSEFLNRLEMILVDGYQVVPPSVFNTFKRTVTQVYKSRENQNGSILRAFSSLRNGQMKMIYDLFYAGGNAHTGL